jgi:hypothetical protein
MYAQISVAEEDEMKELCETAKKLALDAVARQAMKIINTKVVSNIHTKDVAGKYGLGVCNEQRDR